MKFKIDFKKISKKTYIISGCALLAIILAVLLCIFFFKLKNRTANITVPTADVLISSQEPESVPESSQQPEEIKLSISSPSSDSYTTTESTAIIKGSSDPAYPVIMNGEEIKRDESGLFSIDIELKVGKNTFTFEHKGETLTYTITYHYVIIDSYDMAKAQVFSSGSSFVVNVKARGGSKVTATFNGTTITLKEEKNNDAPEQETEQSNTFNNFSGGFDLPSGNTTDLSLGKIKYTATYNGMTESYYSGNITVKKSNIIKDSNPDVTPAGGDYIDVGSGLIATVVKYNAETFDGNTTDDTSRPTNNYLPQGTMDYCAEGFVTNGNNQYAKLRCGKRVYLESYAGKPNKADVISITTGTLPDHNEISVSSMSQDNQYTVLQLDCLWKAPFYFDIRNQAYNNPSSQNYAMSAVTFSYVDITFCYATQFTGDIEIPENNPIFSSAEVIKNDWDYTIRLHLKKTGGLYGWDSFYDSQGRLNFKFLNPAKLSSNDSLAGTRIFVDVGHGGSDGGASGFAYENRESVRNLILAMKIKDKLQDLGATVIMSRTNDVLCYPDDQIIALKQADADFCVAIHHDSSTNKSANGFSAYHFTPFSKTATDYINTRTSNAGIYNKVWDVRSHYFYLARATNCPVVLTENGFISNSGDYNGIINDYTNDRKAEAIVNGIVDYFRSIQ